jgi:hypothetical protein
VDNLLVNRLVKETEEERLESEPVRVHEYIFTEPILEEIEETKHKEMKNKHKHKESVPVSVDSNDS